MNAVRYPERQTRENLYIIKPALASKGDCPGTPSCQKTRQARHGHTGKIADLARDLRKELRQAKYEKFAEVISNIPIGKLFEYYPQCYDVLGAMVKFRCKKGCRNGAVRRSARSGNAARPKRSQGAGSAANQRRVRS